MRLNFRRRLTRVFGLALILAGALAVMAFIGGARSASNAATEAQVRDAFTLAVRVDQGVQVPSLAKTDDRPLEADLTRQLGEGTKAIHSIFADEPAARIIKALENGVQSQRESSDHFRILGAGVGKISFEEVALVDTTATVHATVETWSRTKFKQPAVAATKNKPAFPGSDWIVSEPHNLLDVTATLSQDKTGHWIVAKYDWKFVDGYGPY